MIYEKVNYQLLTPAVFQTNVLPPRDLVMEQITLTITGVLELEKGYACYKPASLTGKASIDAMFAYSALRSLCASKKLNANIWKDMIYRDYVKLATEAGANRLLAEIDRFILQLSYPVD